MHIGDWLCRRAALTPQKVALIDTIGDRRITYLQWSAQANQTAHFLASQGVSHGDRVAVLATNCVEYLDVWFAVGMLGALMQNLSWRLATPELERMLCDTEPSALVFSPEFVPLVNTLRGPTSMRVWVSLGEPADGADLTLGQRASFPTSRPPALDLSPDDPWVLCYTGGTTGLPKAAVLTHRAMTANSVNTIVSWGLRSDDVVPLVSPLFHTGGLNVFTLPLVHIGGTTVVTKGWNADQMFDLIAAKAITLFFAVPTMFTLMQAHPRWETADFGALKYVIIVGRSKDMIISGGENVCPAEVESAMHGHPSVLSAVLIGVPDPVWGAVGRALVVPRPGQQITAEEFQDFLRTQLARYKVPKSVVFLAEMPLTAAGKVDRAALSARYGL